MIIKEKVKLREIVELYATPYKDLPFLILLKDRNKQTFIE